MMICIHPRPESFSDRWIEICKQRQLPFTTLDLLETNILRRLREVNATIVLFHLPYENPVIALRGKHLSKLMGFMGIKVFPNEQTGWHFDDKLAQKYLFEAFEIPCCPTYCFYSRQAALDWAAATPFPKVWKLATGAGSDNVRLVRSQADARRLIHRAFGPGFQPIRSIFGDFRTRVFQHQKRRDWAETVRRLPRTIAEVSFARKLAARERGYAYFQDFMPGNDYDTRITVIGDRAFAFRRFVRPEDFRASGSGRIDWDPKAIDLQCVEIAYEAVQRIGAQCLAFDFIYDAQRKPVVVEISYGFAAQVVHQCPGFWDPNLVFQKGCVWPQDAILDDLLKKA
jgi:glutathione synthase/RimK-type ligase-like ATP-grasp enzyme